MANEGRQRNLRSGKTESQIGRVGMSYAFTRGCVQKKRYATKKQAMTAAATVTREEGGKAIGYRCGYCRHWHVGRDTSGKRVDTTRRQGSRKA